MRDDLMGYRRDYRGIGSEYDKIIIDGKELETNYKNREELTMKYIQRTIDGKKVDSIKIEDLYKTYAHSEEDDFDDEDEEGFFHHWDFLEQCAGERFRESKYNDWKGGFLFGVNEEFDKFILENTLLEKGKDINASGFLVDTKKIIKWFAKNVPLEKILSPYLLKVYKEENETYEFIAKKFGTTGEALGVFDFAIGHEMYEGRNPFGEFVYTELNEIGFWCVLAELLQKCFWNNYIYFYEG